MQAVGGRGSIQHACLGVDGCEEESAADVLNAAPTTDRRSGSPCQKMTTTPVEGTRQTGNPLGEAMREGALAATDATLTTEGEGDKSSSRALVADSSGRVKRSCVRIALNDATPIAPPEKPSPEKPWTPQTCLELADYYRGETLPESTHEDSAYQRAIRAAISLVNKQRATYSQVDAVFRYMCGRDEALKDLWWADKRVDLWHVAEHCSAKLREIERKSNSPPSVSSQPSERPSVLLSEEKRQRNLERLRALAAARTPLYGTA